MATTDLPPAIQPHRGWGDLTQNQLDSDPGVGSVVLSYTGMRFVRRGGGWMQLLRLTDAGVPICAGDLCDWPMIKRTHGPLHLIDEVRFP